MSVSREMSLAEYVGALMVKQPSHRAVKEFAEIRKRLAELEAKEKKGCVHNDLVYLEEVIERRNERIAVLEKEIEKMTLDMAINHITKRLAGRTTPPSSGADFGAPHFDEG